MSDAYDYVIVGGGLQGALIVLALAHHQPRSAVAVVEKASRLGGNHTWCFHAGDVGPHAKKWVEPLVVHRWPGYRVLFPALARSLERPYAAISSARLHAVVERCLASRSRSRLYLGSGARQIEANRVLLENGKSLHAPVVVDARGPGVDAAGGQGAGYQKFLGLEVELTRPHGLDRPVLMDATVAQDEGFRFVYTLPLSETRLLVEDTYFSNTPDLDRPGLRQRIAEHLSLGGHEIAHIQREEEGILPMPWRGSWPDPGRGPLRAGYRGGFFHPGTGYSFPVALRFAERMAEPPAAAAHGALRSFAGPLRRQVAFCHVLNFMLFCWFPPSERWHIFQRFYRLPLKTIERFYALRLGPADMARLLLGRPPRGMSLRYGFTKESQP